MEKIQIAPKKMVEDAIVIWPIKTPDVDIVMDPREIEKFVIKQGSLKAIYCFGLLGITEPNKIVPMLINLNNTLREGGEIYVIEQDFDYVTRGYIGGDLRIAEFNDQFRRTCYLNRDYIVDLLAASGFPQDKQAVWLDPKVIPFEHYEVALSAKKVTK